MRTKAVNHNQSSIDEPVESGFETMKHNDMNIIASGDKDGMREQSFVSEENQISLEKQGIMGQPEVKRRPVAANTSGIANKDRVSSVSNSIEVTQ